jgi:thiamine-phosphate pyrophosphorylase
MSAAARIIDANANRAREAMRVMEDVARFARNDRDLAVDLKGMRHDLRAALDRFPAGWLEANRDAPGDVGATLSTESERRRSGVADIAIAAGKRLGEALRAIEEASKVVAPDVATVIEAIRYRAYDVDARLRARLGGGRARQWSVCVIITESLCGRPWLEVAGAALAGGAECLQLREKEVEGRALRDRAARLVDLARPVGASVIVNDRADVALAAGADGVHLGQGDLPVDRARAIAGSELLIGVSTHDLPEAADAVAAGADYCGVGTIFGSTVKPANAPAGVDLVRRFVAAHPEVPHLAIGGVTTENVGELAAAGAKGVAVSTAVCAAEDPRGVVERLREALGDTSG